VGFPLALFIFPKAREILHTIFLLCFWHICLCVHPVLLCLLGAAENGFKIGKILGGNISSNCQWI